MAVPFSLSAQVWKEPALIWLNVLAGVFVWPCALDPQHTAVASALTPQLWFAPAVIAVNVPPGAPPLGAPPPEPPPELAPPELPSSARQSFPEVVRERGPRRGTDLEFQDPGAR